MKSMKRGIRKQHYERMKRKAKRVYPWCRQPERYANNLKPCSCFMCGNPRRFWRELTYQERRLLADLRHEQRSEAAPTTPADALDRK